MMDDAPTNYKNVLIMKNGIGRKDEQIFLDWFPSEERAATIVAIGSVILESMDLLVV